MSYWDNYEIEELKIIKEKLTQIVSHLSDQYNLFNDIIDDINNSIDGRKF